MVIADIDEERGAEAAETLAAAGGDVRFVGCDVGKRLDVRNLITATVEAHGRVDVLINNAAIVAASEFLELKEEDFDRVLRVNLKGAFLAGQAAARQLVTQVEEGGAPGAIINMSSVNAVLAIPSQLAYSVSKGESIN